MSSRWNALFVSTLTALLLAASVAGCNQRRTIYMSTQAGATPASAAPASQPTTPAATDSAATAAPTTSSATALRLGPDYAGTGLPGFAGDGAPAALAQLDRPDDVVLDAQGNAWVADTANSRVRRVDAKTLVITTVAGDGTFGSSGDGGPATAAQLKAPTGVSLDDAGNLYIADALDHRIRKVDAATGIITTLAGDGAPGFSGDGGPAGAATLNTPLRVRATPQADRIFIVDSGNHRIRKIQGGLMLTVVGNGAPGGVGAFGGDGGLAKDALLDSPSGLAFDERLNLFIADTGNHRVRHMDWATGIVTTLAGGAPGFAGDGGLASAAQLSSPEGVSFDPVSRVLFVADAGNRRIRRLAQVDDPALATITTVAGDGLPAPALSTAFPEPRFTAPQSLALHPLQKALLVVDTQDHRVRFVELRQ